MQCPDPLSPGLLTRYGLSLNPLYVPCVTPVIHGFFMILVVSYFQEDDIRNFVRQEMSQHCGEWAWPVVSWTPSPLHPSTPT